MRPLLVLCTAIFLGGCVSSVDLSHHPTSNIEVIDDKNYSVGVPHKIFVGEKVISRKSYKAAVRENFYKSENDFTLRGGVAGVTRLDFKGYAGEDLEVGGFNEKGNPVLMIPNNQFMFGIDSDGKWDNTLMSNSFWTSPIGSGAPYTMTPKDTIFRKATSTTPVSELGYVNHELVFTGIGANGITLLYREYTFENIARTAFKQELVYPTTATELRFRNYLINVESASSSEMTFTVLEE